MKKQLNSVWVYVGASILIIVLWAAWEALQILLAIKRDVDSGITKGESTLSNLATSITGGFSAVGTKISGGIGKVFSFFGGGSGSGSGDALSPDQLDSQTDADFNTPDPGQGNGETISPDGVVSQGAGQYTSY